MSSCSTAFSSLAFRLGIAGINPISSANGSWLETGFPGNVRAGSRRVIEGRESQRELARIELLLRFVLFARIRGLIFLDLRTYAARVERLSRKRLAALKVYRPYMSASAVVCVSVHSTHPALPGFRVTAGFAGLG